MITQIRLKELFDYSDGQLVRKVGRGKNGSTSRWKVGTCIGHKNSSGYILASVDYKLYKLHRLIWLWHFGIFPEKHIDHIDGNTSNNKIENLRQVTDAQNMQNQRKARVTNKLGCQGVYKVKNKFRSVLTTNGQNKHLGYFDTPEDAHNAYVLEKRKVHQFSTI